MSEVDPNGKSANEPGAKLDAGKVRPALVIQGFRKALLAVSEVGTFGAAKYTDNGWKSVPDGRKRYEDALYRHLLAEGVDEQSRLPHLAHAAWNLLAMLELEQQHLDDLYESQRPRPTLAQAANEPAKYLYSFGNPTFNDPRFGLMIGELSDGNTKGCSDCFYGKSGGRSREEFPQGYRTGCPHLRKENPFPTACVAGALVVWREAEENK